MNHQINTTDLQNFESKTQLAGQFGEEIHKALYVVTSISSFGEVFSYFTVEKHKIVLLTTKDLKEAVTRYNSL